MEEGQRIRFVYTPLIFSVQSQIDMLKKDILLDYLTRDTWVVSDREISIKVGIEMCYCFKKNAVLLWKTRTSFRLRIPYHILKYCSTIMKVLYTVHCIYNYGTISRTRCILWSWPLVKFMISFYNLDLKILY